MGRKVKIFHGKKGQEQIIELIYQDGILLESKNMPPDYKLQITEDTEFLTVSIPFGLYREPCALIIRFFPDNGVYISKYHDEAEEYFYQVDYSLDNNSKNIDKLNKIIEKLTLVQNTKDFSKLCSPLNKMGHKR